MPRARPPSGPPSPPHQHRGFTGVASRAFRGVLAASHFSHPHYDFTRVFRRVSPRFRTPSRSPFLPDINTPTPYGRYFTSVQPQAVPHVPGFAFFNFQHCHLPVSPKDLSPWLPRKFLLLIMQSKRHRLKDELLLTMTARTVSRPFHLKPFRESPAAPRSLLAPRGFSWPVPSTRW